MPEAQRNAPRGIETRDAVKILAVRCVVEGLKATEITDISQETREQLGAYLRHLGGQAESTPAIVEVTSARAKEKTLPLEQAEVIIGILKTRFEQNQKFHEGIDWLEVEKALRAAPKLLWSLQQLEETGGEPDVLKDDGEAFRFVDFARNTSSVRWNLIFDAEAEVDFRNRYPNEVCRNNAAARVAEWGVEFLREDEYHLLQKLVKVDTYTQSWLQSNIGTEKDGYAFCGLRDVDIVRVYREYSKLPFKYRGFRCSLRVPKV